MKHLPVNILAKGALYFGLAAAAMLGIGCNSSGIAGSQTTAIPPGLAAEKPTKMFGEPYMDREGWDNPYMVATLGSGVFCVGQGRATVGVTVIPKDNVTGLYGVILSIEAPDGKVITHSEFTNNLFQNGVTQYATGVGPATGAGGSYDGPVNKEGPYALHGKVTTPSGKENVNLTARVNAEFCSN